MLIGFDDLPPELQKYVSILRQCVHGALEEFSTKYHDLRAKLSPRSEASVIHDLMVFNVKTLVASSHPELDWSIRKNLFLISVGQDFRIKMKRLYGNWRPKNIQTRLSFDFDHQKLRLFDDFDPSICSSATVEIPSGS